MPTVNVSSTGNNRHRHDYVADPRRLPHDLVGRRPLHFRHERPATRPPADLSDRTTADTITPRISTSTRSGLDKEWSPALAAPALTGLLCWAKPAGAVPYSLPGKSVEVPWDAVWWWTRPDGVLQLQLGSRLTKQPELLAPFEVRSPLWAGHTLVLNPTVPRTAEVMGSPEASQLVSIVGAAWLLMSQPAVIEIRTWGRGGPGSGDASGATGPGRESSNVTIIDMRRPVAAAQDELDGASGRQYRRRWWVGGHWRQQACGPGRTQRKPIWVSPYVKGPEGFTAGRKRKG